MLPSQSGAHWETSNLLVTRLEYSAALHIQAAPGRRIERAERTTGFARAKPEARTVKRGRCPSRTMLSAEPSEPCGLDCQAVSKHCPPQHPPRRRCVRLRRTKPRLPSAVRTVPGFAVHRPAAPQAEDCRLRRQSSAGGQFANRSLAAIYRCIYCVKFLVFPFLSDYFHIIVYLFSNSHYSVSLPLHALEEKQKSLQR